MKHLYLFFLFMLAAFGVASAQNGTNFTGTVTTTASAPLSGATVSLLNTNYATTTNQQGSFTFKNVPVGSYTLHVSSVAYAAISKNITIGAGNQPISIQLSEESSRLDEVVVTAQKREESAQQVPFSISTLSAKQVQEYKIWNLKDITAIVPNLYSAGPGDDRNVTGLRGVATTSYDPAVATYIDGVNQFSLDTYIPQLFDVERVEVLRGPQGSLYGRNAMGGVINIITKQPTNQTTGFAEVNFGSYGQKRISAGIRTPLIADKLFLGVAGLYNGFDGFYNNQFNNTKLDKQHSFLGNYYLKYLASQTFALTLNVKTYINRNNGPFALSGSPDDALANPFQVSQNATTKMIDNTLNASLSANYTGKGFNFTSNTAYQKNNRYYTLPIDGDFSPADQYSLINNYGPDFNKVKVTTQEFRFSSPASATKIKWTAGLYGFYRYAPTKTGTHIGADTAYLGVPFPNFSTINTNIERNYGTAFFGQVTFALAPKVDLTAGLRYDYEHKKEEVNGELRTDGGYVMVTQNDTSSTASFKAFTPKLSLAYHVSDANNLYATYSRGFRAGGISQLGADQSQPPLFAYKPEYSNNFEVGSKNFLLDNKLRVNVSLFYISINNAQVPTLVLPQAITVTKNAGKLHSKGAELELATTAIKGFDISYNFGYTHARYTDLNVPNNGSVVSLKGNRQVYTPDVTSMLAIQYNYRVTADVKLIARGEWKYLGKQYFDLGNNVEQKSYSLFNARLGVSTRKFDLFAWGSNLSNKHYIDYAYDFGASHLGNPRMYGVTLRTNF
ncbi:TonB-dependent receptor [Mucilaginibacter psychrotolerans]|uniref:TonB-dependent receptor n=1 Tax=Mucilaginibacter psychrotolerans TaxID=1524096 RepID=A0A4Y8S750_9SPHI|nr:TonB-dependent receptor [Mucilaginibacter psychrotolerans]TFF34752.1 TonB-dependent receptor [Mucilaginibacter psychrotolerans]